ncbi:hypothetical protein CW731_15225 [Polaribacter sp. ALD11]|uniref:hypothetical protein n=1 Tax=Polaribacter sp. ALD11 TaxID=2058137 RepID=UPI000C3007CA|nr:hypothetical protein [Polaribacter sp. ALD11]AUC86549.1 hypothetical protein CW731_15225 [Polaribacter sp. ALD11]
MTLELIIFIASILFGVILYWRESRTNKVYRFFNKLMNSKELQMKVTDKKGFFYEQNFLLRLVFIVSFFLLVILVTRFLIPIDVATISLFASMIFGTLIGTYLAGFIFTSTKIIDEHSDSLEDKFKDVLEKGKDFVEDFKNEEPVAIEKAQKEIEKSKVEGKSARERLKEKGLL